MKKALNIWSRFALLGAVLCMVSMPALAQRGGSGGSGGGGGGGGTSVNTAPLLTFDFSAPVGGVTPTWSGDYTVTNSIPGYYSFAVLNVSIKAKSINLPDYSVVQVTAYTSDKLTGQPFPPVAMAGMSIVNKTGTLKSNTTLYNSSFTQITRQLDKIVLTTADGTVIATCHP